MTKPTFREFLDNLTEAEWLEILGEATDAQNKTLKEANDLDANTLFPHENEGVKRL